jgi:hypothetical protein
MKQSQQQTPQVDVLSPKQRMWLTLWSTLLSTPVLMGITFQMARVSLTPIIAAFAPCVLLSLLKSPESRMLTVYLLMPVQCLTYGGLLALAERTGHRKRLLAALLPAHAILAAVAFRMTGGNLG